MTKKKIYILDTSVLLFDSTCIYKFEDNDIVIPISVLEELDTKKVGNESINFHARQIIRNLEMTFNTSGTTIWSKIENPNYITELGNIEIEVPLDPDQKLENSACETFNKYSNDNRIVDCALKYQMWYSDNSKGCEVILVSKDVNLRLKAKSLGLKSEDFLNSKVEFSDEELPEVLTIENLDIFSDLYKNKSHGSCSALDALGDQTKVDLLINNAYYELDSDSRTALVRYNKNLKEFIRIDSSKYAYNVKGKNKEQKFALDALLDPDRHLVILEGQSGSGKTILALAAALEQKADYQKIVLSKPTVAVSKEQEVGFLKGDLNEKLMPWMKSYMDNFDLIQELSSGKKASQIDKYIEEGKVEMAALAFLRGRSLNSSFFVIDEAQNLTPHEVKTIVTRAGMGTKLVFMGDTNQIDTPYLDKKSNGLSYLKSKMRGNDIVSYVKLQKGERSQLANLANELL